MDLYKCNIVIVDGGDGKYTCSPDCDLNNCGECGFAIQQDLEFSVPTKECPALKYNITIQEI